MYSNMKKTILFSLIVILVGISFFNVFYNLNKTIVEVKEWAYLTNQQKRQKNFGDLYTVAMLIEKNTMKKSQILLVGKEKMPYYFTRYYLYPRRIYPTTAKELAKTNKQKKYQYIFVYNTKIATKDYKEIASFSSKSGNYGRLYIKK